MAAALITGIGGFTGRYLANELRSAGYTVTGIGQERIDGYRTCDLLDRTSLGRVLAEDKPDVVVHLAGIAFVGHGDVNEMYRTNIVGTRNLLEAIVESGARVRSVLLASSANIYGNAAVDVINEDTPAAPENDYAVSKLAMEYMARLWSDRLPITIVRPFNYTGVGQSLSFLLPKIVDHFRRRAPVLELGNLDVVRDFWDVRAVVRRYRLLLDSGRSGDVFNVCSGCGHSLLEVLQMMREISQHSLEVRVNPAFVRGNEVQRLIGSRAKLDAAIGIEADISFAETLKWMLGSSV